ncbi:MAG: hypothetical protein LBH13_02520 [Cellulomonadaceae bacterium]|jgi:uncharacterized DUF497 family protein|nr:hypothetical protein [Cellulomonadaceae bacterium]
MVITWSSDAEEHMFVRHRVTVAEANEALADADRLIESPDHASRSGLTDRIVGYSHSRQQVLCVIVMQGGEGINAWPANESYRRRYQEGMES